MIYESFRLPIQRIKMSKTNFNFPHWVCPHCKIGALIPNKDKIREDEFEHSKKNRKVNDWDPDWIRQGAIGELICNHHSCKDVVFFLGRSEYEPEYEETPDGWEQDWCSVIYPLYFYPPIEAFKWSSHFPKDLREVMLESFALFWSHESSAANKIRVATEGLLDILKIKKIGPKKNKLALHARIGSLPAKYGNIRDSLFAIKFIGIPAKYGNIRDSLFAIKFIGNPASHFDQTITRSDLVDAYEIFEDVLNKLFDKSSKRLEKVKKDILKRGKPRSKKEKSPF